MIDDVLGEFAVLFAADLTDHRCRLDFFECRFNAAFRTFYLRYIRLGGRCWNFYCERYRMGL
jgi:hypothetical protein